MKDETQVATVEAAQLYRQATDVAGLCREIVMRTAVNIQGRSYVKVEGWMSIATAHGCVASARDVEEVAQGVRAIAEIRRIKDGAVLCTAEGFVGKDEPTWYGGEIQTARGTKTLLKRADYAIRAMAQTRAVSRACRTAFAHVVVLMDAGLSTTPAEEVPYEGFDNHEVKAEPAQKTATTETTAVQVPRDGEVDMRQAFEGGKWRKVKIHFGKNKDVELDKLGDQALLWYIDEWQPKPYNGNISATDIALRAALDVAKVEAFEL